MVHTYPTVTVIIRPTKYTLQFCMGAVKWILALFPADVGMNSNTWEYRGNENSFVGIITGAVHCLSARTPGYNLT